MTTLDRLVRAFSVRTMRVVVACAIGASFLSACSSEVEKTDGIVFPMPDFRHATPAILDRQTDEAVKVREDIINQLMGNLRRPGLTNAAKVRIVYLLGKLRAIRATGILIRNINLRDENPPPSLRLPRWFQYPARGALVKVGHYALRVMIRDIGSEQFRQEDVEGYAHVFMAIEGPRYAVMKLQDHLAKAEDDKSRKHYEMVIERVKEMEAGMAK